MTPRVFADVLPSYYKTETVIIYFVFQLVIFYEKDDEICMISQYILDLRYFLLEYFFDLEIVN